MEYGEGRRARGTRALVSMSDMTAPLFLGLCLPPGLGHPIFSPSHLAGKTPPPLYLATDGRRPDLPPGLVGARGGLGTSVRGERVGRGWRRKRERGREKASGHIQPQFFRLAVPAEELVQRLAEPWRPGPGSG